MRGGGYKDRKCCGARAKIRRWRERLIYAGPLRCAHVTALTTGKNILYRVHEIRHARINSHISRPSHAVYVAHASAAWLKSGFVPHPPRPSPIPVPTAMSTLSLRASRCSLVTWVQLSRSWTDGKRRMGGRSKQQTWAWQWQQPQHAQQKSQQLRLVFFANSQQTP